MTSVIATKQLSYPSGSFENVHCSSTELQTMFISNYFRSQPNILQFRSSSSKTLLDLFWATRRDQIMVNLQDYKEKLDCDRYVAVITYVSLREMIKPGAFTIISPMIIRWLIACHLNLLLLLISLRVK
uniref:Uncharacterized protein n=1 Tax=Populus trichocarpa TaxID=3694 RepID=A0A3N7HTT5_POPTR